MPRIVAHAKQGMDVLPLIVSPSAWRLEKELARLHARPTDGRALSLRSESQIDRELASFTYELAARVGISPAGPERSLISESGASALAQVSGLWTGFYNLGRPIRLLIQESKGETFHGTPSSGSRTNPHNARTR